MDQASIERKRQQLQARLDAFLPRMRQTAAVLAGGAIAVVVGHFGVVDAAHNHALVSEGLAMLLEMGGALTMAAGAIIGISHLFGQIGGSAEMLSLRHKLSAVDGGGQEPAVDPQEAQTREMSAVSDADAPRIDF